MSWALLHLGAGPSLATAAPAPTPTPRVEPGATARPEITVDRGIVYAEVAGQKLALDLYRPVDSATAPYPVLLFFHGGGWVSGSRLDAVPRHDPRTGADLARSERSWPSMLPYVRRGVALVSADYRLGPGAPEPAAVEDAMRALSWVATRGPSYDLDPDRVVLAGVSAGAHLALLAAFTGASGQFLPAGTPALPRPLVRGVIDLYGVADVADLLSGPNERPFTALWVPSRSQARARQLSPLTYVRPGLPPVLIVHGDADPVVPHEQSQRLANALEEAGDQVRLLTLPGGGHGCDPDELETIQAAVLGFLEDQGLVAPTPTARQPTPPGPVSGSSR